MVAIFATVTSQCADTKTIDNNLTDYATNLGYSKRSERLIVVSADSGEWLLTEETLRQIQSQMLAANPAAVVYTFSLPAGFRNEIENSNYPIVYALSANSLQSVSPNIETLPVYPPKGAIAAATFNKDGVVREQRLFFNTENGIRSSIALAALAAAGFVNQTASSSNGKINVGEINLRMDDSFNISPVYSGAAKSYPYIPVSKILSGEIPVSILKGKILFVGPTSVTNSRQWLTPASIDNVPISETELWAQTADAILGERFLTSPNTFFSLLLVFLAVALSGLLFRFLSPLKGALALLILLLATALMNIGFILLIQLKTPFSAIAIGLVLSFTVLTVAKTVRVRELLKELVSRIKFRSRGAAILTAEEAENKRAAIDWEQIGAAVSYYFGGLPSLFIIREEKSGKWNLTYADPRVANDIQDENFHDSSTIIGTLRQSVEPQSTREFLESKKEVLLLPLGFGKKLIGAFGLVIDNTTQNFQMPLATRLAAEISALLVDTNVKASKINREFNQSPFVEINILEQTVERLTSEESFLRTVLERGADAIGVAHPLGRALFYNPRFVQVLTDCKADFSEDNLLGSVARLFTAKADEFTQALSKATVNRAETVLGIDTENGSSYKLTISPLYSEGAQHNTDVSVMAPGYMETVNTAADKNELSQLRGLVFTLADTTEFRVLDEMKSHLIANIQGVSQNLLTPIVAYGEILSESKKGSDSDQEMLDIIVDRAKSLSGIFRQFTQIADSRLDGSKNNRGPVNLIALLENEITAVNPQAKERSVDLVFDGPAVITPVFANSEEIVQAIRSLFNFVVQGAAPDSQVKLDLTERELDIQILIATEGLGLPPKVMEHLVNDGAGMSGENLTTAKEVFENHGGYCRFTSSLKEGLRIEASLPKDWYFQNYISRLM
ncbi:MAG: CHASE2 domain-containing protein [Acidobacteria bacterium]|nr:CHASE2 domain-containing protein [Acidobacteriota bacterium]MCA1638853.1 CHASE2 domain-containing protein [Acidobacteriota bacterium]